MNTSPVITVSQLNFYVKSLLESDGRLSSVYVTGEISNFTNHYRTGHFYFTLKDENAAVKAVMFKTNAQRLRFLPENGMKVIIRGRISLFERDGQFQLYADDMQPDGVGALTVAFEQLRQKLEKEGLFSSSAKKPIPAIPGRVGVITSPTGAAVRDIFTVLGRRFPLAEIVFMPVQVQGPSAAPQICEAIGVFNRKHLADVLIVGRGGGSIEDLWAFNEESTARAVYKSEIPVISAVGHETDYTICDFVADLRAPTPSAAAEVCVPEKGEQYLYVSGLINRAHSLINNRISAEKNRIKVISSSEALRSPISYVNIQRMILDRLLDRLVSAQTLKLSNCKRQFADTAGKLNALSPLAVLSRGYAAVYSGNNVVSRSKDLNVGDPLTVRFSDGTAECEITALNT